MVISIMKMEVEAVVGTIVARTEAVTIDMETIIGTEEETETNGHYRR